MENTNITDNTRQAGHSADSTINAGTDIKSSTTNTSQHTIDDINSGQQPAEMYMNTGRNQSTAIRQYKDNVFCLLYRDKNNLLDLYNGLNDTDYTNVDDLTVTTLKGGVYMKYKNDASFVFGQDLYMFEQQ